MTHINKSASRKVAKSKVLRKRITSWELTYIYKGMRETIEDRGPTRKCYMASNQNAKGYSKK